MVECQECGKKQSKLCQGTHCKPCFDKLNKSGNDNALEKNIRDICNNVQSIKI